MSEPKVEFHLNEIVDEPTKEQFDQFRRWYEFREDVKTPSMQVFTGFLVPDSEVLLHVPGVVVGYSGMTEYSGGYWAPMYFSTTVQVSRLYFGLETDNTEGSYVKVVSNSANARELRYRVTILYRDA